MFIRRLGRLDFLGEDEAQEKILLSWWNGLNWCGVACKEYWRVFLTDQMEWSVINTMGMPVREKDGMLCWADFSPCRTWRYSLSRRWDDGPSMAVIGLNPSIANEMDDDPTIRRCVRFAKDWGFSGLWMLNLFAMVSTDPDGLKTANSPIGIMNDVTIITAAQTCGLTLAAWGAYPFAKHRARNVAKILEDRGCKLHCLGFTKDGSPKHPLYVPASKSPEIWGPQ